MTPDEYTIQETFLNVGDGHELYVQDWGNPQASDVIIFLHGGPGAGIKDRHRSTFDPERQRVIFFDQRGTGRSVPASSLTHNTTQDLIEDINKIAEHFKLKDFVITGGSWGSCLALAYALQHPNRVKALVLSGIFTASQQEIDWLAKGMFRVFYPDVWQEFVNTVPKSHQQDPSAYHYKRILTGNEDDAKQSAYTYLNLEAAVMSLDDRFTPPDYETFDPSGTKTMVHYMTQLCFLPDRHILDNAHTLRMPVWIVQGRYDTICPPEIAYELHSKLPNSQLIWTLSNHRSEREDWNVLRTILARWS